MEEITPTRKEREKILRPFVQIQPAQIKKIPRDLRKKKYSADTSLPIGKRLLEQMKNDSQFFRSAVQAAFVLLCLWIGVEFYLFMQWGSTSGVEPFYQRPPGAEGFLPISALMGLLHWIMSGSLNSIHPAGTIILTAFIAISIAMKKSFCSWMCPVGTLSKSLWMLGQKIFGRNFQVWKWLDYALRSLKYFLLSFFVYSIVSMSVDDLTIFINSPYNKVADIKMYLFFAEISQFALWTIIVLMVCSLFIKNFWCRYLCPYGALLGIAGMLSPFRITRTKATCVDCELCTKVCPANIQIHTIGQSDTNKTVGQVWNDECTSCMRCVEECPVKDTLLLRTKESTASVPTWVMGSLIIGVFLAVTGLGMLTGHWKNSISSDEYLFRFQRLDSPLYNHARGQVPHYRPND